MTKIGLISDTHHFLDEAVFKHFKHCDEIWHIGDFGTVDIANQLKQAPGIKTFRGVYGNIDGMDVRSQYPEQLVFDCEGVKVMLRHIGGSPPKYNPETKKQLLIHQPQLLVCGHSHILKIMFDEKMQCLFINPGAVGRQGWHKVRTIVHLTIDGSNMKDCEVIELGKR